MLVTLGGQRELKVLTTNARENVSDQVVIGLSFASEEYDFSRPITEPSKAKPRQPWIANDITEIVLTPQFRYCKGNLFVFLVRDSYDAFICYDEGDRAFVDKLVKRMESEPYNRHVCDTRRDLLPGGSRFEGIATAIEKNCRNVVLVWSRNYHDSEKARFESDVAMSMSTGQLDGL